MSEEKLANFFEGMAKQHELIMKEQPHICKYNLARLSLALDKNAEFMNSPRGSHDTFHCASPWPRKCAIENGQQGGRRAQVG
jgi:hypothetical protein